MPQPHRHFATRPWRSAPRPHSGRGSLILAATVLAGLCQVALPLAAADRELELGAFRLTAPEAWEQRPPRSQLVAYEFAAPAAEGDQEAGRFTLMAAGGGVEANIDRWIGQFTQPDGSPTKDRTKIDKREISGQTVHLVDIRGTYEDKPAPFSPGVKKPNFRLLGAIIVTDEASFFLKLTGPEATLAGHEQAFGDLLNSLRQP